MHCLPIYGFEEYKLFFYTLYLWIETLVIRLVISYHNFLVFFSPSCKLFSHVYFLRTRERLTLLMIFSITYKKKKKKSPQLVQHHKPCRR
jgi:hypothetical protein